MARNIRNLSDDPEEISEYADYSFEGEEELIPNRKVNGRSHLVHTPDFYVWGYTVDEEKDPDGFSGGVQIEETRVHDPDNWCDEREIYTGDIGWKERRVNKGGKRRSVLGYELSEKK